MLAIYDEMSWPKSKFYCSSIFFFLQDLESDKDIEDHLSQMQQEIKSKENTLMKTAAPNLRAVEKLQIARDKFQESIDGNTESFVLISFCDCESFHPN